MNSGRLSAAACALALGLVAHPAAAQQSYPQTLYWGSGLVDIPVAWVSPVTGDFALGYSGQTLRMNRSGPGTRATRVNAQGNVSLSLFGRAEVGAALVSDNPEWGLFGRLLLVDARDFAGEPGVAQWIPNLAVGVRNVGPFKRLDRFGLGYDLFPGRPGGPHVVEPSHAKFNTANTVYVVATKAIALGSARASGLPGSGVSFTLGYGNGLFSDDGGMGRSYASHASGGLFGGIEASVAAGDNTTFSLMAENNAWDYNAGLVVDYRGVRVGAYATEIGSTAPAAAPAGGVFNYGKFAFTVGWRGNVFGLARDHVLQDRLARLEKQRALLVAQLSLSEERAAALELQVRRYQAQGLLDLEDRRAQADRELSAEHEELRRLREQLRHLEQEAVVAAGPSSSSKPPR